MSRPTKPSSETTFEVARIIAQNAALIMSAGKVRSSEAIEAAKSHWRQAIGVAEHLGRGGDAHKEGPEEPNETKD